MPLKKRAKYLLYLLLHMGMAVLASLLLEGYGFQKPDNLAVLIVTPFAIGAYLAIVKFFELYKYWQYRRGRNVYEEEAYEDDAGFIHLNQKMAQVNKHDWEVIEIVKDSTTFAQSGWDGDKDNTSATQGDGLVELHLNPPDDKSKTAT